MMSRKKSKLSIIKIKKLQKRYNIDCNVGTTIIFDDDYKIYDILKESQKKIGFEIKSVFLSKGYVISITIDKKHPIYKNKQE